MARVLVTGGAGFIGSHVAEYYARQKWQVRVVDNLSRPRIFAGKLRPDLSNWTYLEQFDTVELIRGDVRNAELVESAAADVDLIVHCAAQTAVTTSLVDPRMDFENNVVGTFNVLEAARRSRHRPTVVFCSTNKVYGENVNLIPVREKETRYEFDGLYRRGISETFGVDNCEHTPYGASKLTADIYAQEYANQYGLRVGVFRMSCIYGTRQFGVEDQGWVAWFAIAALTGQPITIYGDGKQVRDVLFVSDLVRAFDAFVQSDWQHLVVNMGGGPDNTLSLLELIRMLEDLTGRSLSLRFDEWRPSDQKVYISDISQARLALRWEPKIAPEEGVKRLVSWVAENRHLFEETPQVQEVPAAAEAQPADVVQA